MRTIQDRRASRGVVRGSTTVAPVMFGKPLLNNVLAFDHVLLQKMIILLEILGNLPIFRVCQTLEVLG